MSNALEQARAVQREQARETTVRISLDLLESLIMEIERLKSALDQRPVIQTGHREIHLWPPGNGDDHD